MTVAPKLEVLLTTVQGSDDLILVIMDKQNGQQVAMSMDTFDELIEFVYTALEKLEGIESTPAVLH